MKPEEQTARLQSVMGKMPVGCEVVFSREVDPEGGVDQLSMVLRANPPEDGWPSPVDEQSRFDSKCEFGVSCSIDSDKFMQLVIESLERRFA